MARSTPMDHESADRIRAAADRDPNSPTATSGFDDRAHDAANRNDAKDPYDDGDYSTTGGDRRDGRDGHGVTNIRDAGRTTRPRAWVAVTSRKVPDG